MKTIDLLKDKFFKKDKSATERLERNKVRLAIENACKEYLQDFDDVLLFEALPNALDSTLEVIEDSVLTSKYEFVQVSETLFRVRLREVSIL